MKIKLIPPRKNLGCLGLSIGEGFYVDLFRSPYLGTFWSIKGLGKLWLHPKGFRFEGKFFLQFRPFSSHPKKLYFRDWS